MMTASIGLFQLNNILLFLLLVIILVISLKILKIFFQTLLIAILSAVFYVFLSYSGANLDINATNILFFSLAGTILFIIYSVTLPFVSLIFKTGHKIVKESTKIVKRAKKPKSQKSPKMKEKEVILKEIKND